MIPPTHKPKTTFMQLAIAEAVAFQQLREP